MTSQRNQGMLFVLVGPGGVGKNAILKDVLDRVDNISQLATATTRPPRDGEHHGKQRLFVSHAEFKRMLAENELVEHQEVHTGDYYGVPRVSLEHPFSIGHDLIADIDMRGANTLRSGYPNNIVLIFISPPGNTLNDMLNVLNNRLQTRGATSEETRQRIQRAPDEMAFARLCDYLVINDNLEKATETLYGIILAERSRRALLALRAEQGLLPHRFAYAASVVPVYQDEVLYHRTGKHFPTDKVLLGELPHEAALRMINHTFGIQANGGKLLRSNDNDMSNNFVPPLLLQYEENLYEELVVFNFIYLLNERIHVKGWDWVSVSEVNSPISAALNDLNVLRPNP